MGFTGLFVALITPFDQFGNVDEEKYEELVERQIMGGVDGVVCLSTTGEHLTLTSEECSRLIHITVRKVNKRAFVIAGTGSCSTHEAVKKTKEAKDLGVDGCLVIMPYCNKPNALGCLAHFKAIAKVGLPMIPYYHPGRTGVSLTPHDLAKICQIPEVHAIKDCSGDLNFFSDLVNLTDKPILIGDDDLLISSLKLGGQGIVSVTANAFPSEWKQIVSGNSEEIFFKYQSLIRAIFQETNPQGIKYAMSLIGLCEPIFRLPLVHPSKETCEAIQEGLCLTITHKSSFS